jgi:hypothetical protein
VLDCWGFWMIILICLMTSCMRRKGNIIYFYLLYLYIYSCWGFMYYLYILYIYIRNCYKPSILIIRDIFIVLNLQLPTLIINKPL